MLGQAVHADKVKSVGIFAGLSRKEQALLGKLADDVQFDAGEEIVREGTIGYDFYVIVEGAAEVLRSGEKIATLSAGDYFGELALLDRSPRNATVRAATSLRALVFPMREFDSAVQQIPGLANRLLRGMAKRIHAADGHPKK